MENNRHARTMKRFLPLLLIILIIVIFGTLPSQASEQCFNAVCIDVFTDPATSQIVITASKAGSPAPAKKTTTTRIVQPKKKIAVWIPWLPKPLATTLIEKRTLTPILKKKKVAKPITSTINSLALFERLTSLVPTGKMLHQPLGDPLVQVPTYFFTTTPTSFRTVIVILKVLVTINLYPTFTWSFGDGASLTTIFPGAIYPLPGITHTYQRSGDFTLSLSTSWSGTWSVNGVVLPIGGGLIVRNQSESIHVKVGATRFID